MPLRRGNQLYANHKNMANGIVTMLELALAAGALLTGIGAIFAGLAKLRTADALKIWALRCDPMIPNFASLPVSGGLQQLSGRLGR